MSDFWLYFNLKTTDHPINQSNRTTHTHPRHHLPSMIYTFSLSLKQQTQNTETSINKTLFHFSSNEAFYSSIALWFSLCLSRWKSWRCVALHRGKRVNQIQLPPSILPPPISSALVCFSVFFLGLLFFYFLKTPFSVYELLPIVMGIYLLHNCVFVLVININFLGKKKIPIHELLWLELGN